jgi:hypothetical protein
MQEDLEKAHKHSIRNKAEVAGSDLCGCFCCEKTFASTEVKSFTDLKGRKGKPAPSEPTALCPFCGIDAVIGAGAGFPLTKDFLSAMSRHWFSRPKVE